MTTPWAREEWIDLPIKEIPQNLKDVAVYDNDIVHCPQCHGRGGRLNKTHNGERIHQTCFQCYGKGWVLNGSPNDLCIHDFDHVLIGNCLHKCTCKLCGHSRMIDSGD